MMWSQKFLKEQLHKYQTKGAEWRAMTSISCDAMMHVLKDFISLKYSELLTEEISKSN